MMLPFPCTSAGQEGIPAWARRPVPDGNRPRPLVPEDALQQPGRRQVGGRGPADGRDAVDGGRRSSDRRGPASPWLVSTLRSTWESRLPRSRLRHIWFLSRVGADQDHRARHPRMRRRWHHALSYLLARLAASLAIDQLLHMSEGAQPSIRCRARISRQTTRAKRRPADLP